jgi:MFS family permease
MAFVIYPLGVWELYILRFFISIGCLPIVASPLIPDYVEKSSIGKAYGMGFTFSILGIIATTLIQPHIPESDWFLQGMSLAYFIIGLSFFVLLKDVKESTFHG